MLRGVFGAIARGLGAMVAGAVNLCGCSLSALATLFGFVPSPMALPEIDLEEWAALKQPAPTDAEVLRSQVRVASNAYDYAVDCVCDRARAPMPKVPKVTAAWLRGLDYSELERLANAGSEAVAAHMRGHYIAGVPRVQPLPQRELVPPPAPVFTAAYEEYELALSGPGGRRAAA